MSILERLEGVRQVGPGKWKAKCPAHEDKTPSLNIRELADGTLLLHDFAGCHPLDICKAAGLEFRDLFPAGHIRRVHPDERPRLSAADALAALNHEIAVAAYVAADLIERREISQATWERLALAHRRISWARVECCPARLRT
jgi:hypothetical protein